MLLFFATDTICQSGRGLHYARLTLALWGVVGSGMTHSLIRWKPGLSNRFPVLCHQICQLLPGLQASSLSANCWNCSFTKVKISLSSFLIFPAPSIAKPKYWLLLVCSGGQWCGGASGVAVSEVKVTSIAAVFSWERSPSNLLLNYLHRHNAVYKLWLSWELQCIQWHLTSNIAKDSHDRFGTDLVSVSWCMRYCAMSVL